MKSISIDQITAAGLSILELKQQKTEVDLDEVRPPLTAGPNSLVFASTGELLHTAIQRNAQALVLPEALYNQALSIIPKNTTIWTTRNVQAAMSVILPLFDKNSEHLKPGIHPTAVIHPSAKVAASAHIGAYAVIEAFAEVGESTIIFPFVYVGSFCRIGNRCRLSPHVTVGSDGFGFYTDKTFTHHKIAQIGSVVIEDDCEFGAHCAIDRATLTETKIKKGSKFDNFCHIAHNVQIGENAMITAGFIVAGSTIIGKNLMTSGGTHVLGHLTVADNVILGPRAGVLQSIEKSGMYGGYPLETYKESVKTLLSLPQVKKLRKQVSKILKQLNITEEE